MRDLRMAKPWSRSRLALAAAAGAYAACTILYSLLWMAAIDWLPSVELGFENGFSEREHALPVTRVVPNSPAEKAGLQPGDRIIAVNRRPIESAGTLHSEYRNYRPGDSVRLTVLRDGHAEPIVLTGVFRLRVEAPREGVARLKAVLEFFPVPFAVVGLAVLFTRLEDRNAWLLALLFGSFIASPGFPAQVAVLARDLEPLTAAYRSLFRAGLGPLFYCFFALFPERSPLDRRAPWLKWIALASAFCFGLPGLRTGVMEPPAFLNALLGAAAAGKLMPACLYGFVALGLVSLALNFFGAGEEQARRKIRVLFFGTAAGLFPAVVVGAAADLTGFPQPTWLNLVTSMALFAFPLSFAYAVVKHRVLEIPALLRTSARYLLVMRGFTVTLALVSIGVTLLFASWLPRRLTPSGDTGQPAGIAAGALLGGVLLWSGSRVHRRVRGRIDRAFFRGAYDARRILEDLVARTPRVTDRAELARLLENHVGKALQPASLTVLLQNGREALSVFGGGSVAAIPADTPLLLELAASGQPREFDAVRADGAGGAVLASLQPECLAPMLGRGGRLEGLLALGPRLSEESYSGEDKRLLASVASHAGTALENLRLAEEIAERIDAERRAAREMEIAKEVQSRLLPQEPPRLRTLEVAAGCVQARQVGGDSFDFLDLGPGRTGFVLADVCGKGVHAALLMANLQAHLRSQSGVLGGDPARLLVNVNRMLWRSTGAQHYATLFFGVYEEESRRLTYVNCGHNPPLWFRRGGCVRRLEATATVVGMFEQWECEVSGIEMEPGDLLAIFSDGIPEAAGTDGEEFGEERLTAYLRPLVGAPVGDLVNGTLAEVQRFSAGRQSDDLTLVVARCREARSPDRGAA